MDIVVAVDEVVAIAFVVIIVAAIKNLLRALYKRTGCGLTSTYFTKNCFSFSMEFLWESVCVCLFI